MSGNSQCTACFSKYTHTPGARLTISLLKSMKSEDLGTLCVVLTAELVSETQKEGKTKTISSEINHLYLSDIFS